MLFITQSYYLSKNKRIRLPLYLQKQICTGDTEHSGRKELMSAQAARAGKEL